MSLTLDPSSTLGFPRPFTADVKRFLAISNPNEQPITFKVKTTAPKLYCVRPIYGRVEPGETVEVAIVLQAMKEEPPLDTQCKHKFLIQSVVITPEREAIPLGDIWTDLTPEDVVHSQKLRVAYLPPGDKTVPEQDHPRPPDLSSIPSQKNVSSSRSMRQPELRPSGSALATACSAAPVQLHQNHPVSDSSSGGIRFFKDSVKAVKSRGSQLCEALRLRSTVPKPSSSSSLGVSPPSSSPPEVGCKSVLTMVEKHGSEDVDFIADYKSGGSEGGQARDFMCTSCMSKLGLHDQQSQETLCPPMTVSCPCNSNTCPWAVNACSELTSTYLPTCHHEGTKELVGVLVTNTQTLSKDNTLLKQKVEALEDKVNALSMENEEIKRMFGASYKLQTPQYSLPGRSDSSPAFPPRRTWGDSTFADAIPMLSAFGIPVHGEGLLHTRTSAPTGAPSSSRTSSAGDPASYFSPAVAHYTLNEGEILFPPAVTAWSTNPFIVEPHLWYDPSARGHPSTSFYPPPLSTRQGALSSSSSPPSITSLNTGMPFDHTFLRLSESIVTSSSAVESLTARHDVILAPETMHTNEDTLD